MATNEAINVTLRQQAGMAAEDATVALGSWLDGQLVAQLRAGYFADPTATEEDFQRALPELRAAWRQRQALGEGR